MKTAIKYYSVGINGSWTKEPAEESWFTSRGASIKESRSIGDKQMFVSGKMCGYLFSSQSE